jgi:hypothetical protein
LRDRFRRFDQLPAFNTAAGEKINADKRLGSIDGLGRRLMVKLRG